MTHGLGADIMTQHSSVTSLISNLRPAEHRWQVSQKQHWLRRRVTSVVLGCPAESAKKLRVNTRGVMGA